MAERRMFAKTIIGSDAFSIMPATAQALYLHLGMAADDEGFVNNPKQIAMLIGGSEDDLKILIERRFIIDFDSGVIAIKHWNINNSIRPDRKKTTVYQSERSQLVLRENGRYSIRTEEDGQFDAGLRTNSGHMSVKCPHSQGQSSLGQNRLDKSSISQSICDRLTEDEYKKLDAKVISLIELFNQVDDNTDISKIKKPYEYCMTVAKEKGMLK